MFNHDALYYLLEFLNLIYVLACVPIFFIYLERLKKKKYNKRLLVIAIYFLVFMAYLELNEGIYKSGDHQEYYKNGVVKSWGVFVLGSREGIHRFYNEDGSLQIEWIFKNDKANGPAKRYYPTGEVMIVCPYKNGLKDGLTNVYYRSGKLMAESLYVNDILTSRKTYNEAGQLTKEENFDASKKTGVR